MKAKGKRKKKKREAKNGYCYWCDFKREVVVTETGALATGSQTQLPQPISAAEALGDWAECWYPVANAPGLQSANLSSDSINAP